VALLYATTGDWGGEVAQGGAEVLLFTARRNRKEDDSPLFQMPACPRIEPHNDEGARIHLSRESLYAGLWYCGRRLGTDPRLGGIPGTDGQCGPTNGPQCQSCRRFQTGSSGKPEVTAVALGGDCGLSASRGTRCLWLVPLREPNPPYFCRRKV
jgi:hypothetical protein